MRGKLMFLGGLAAGFVLGTRAGREKYDEIVRAARRVRDNPTVQEATGVVQEQASRFVSTGKDVMTDKLSHTRFADTPVGQRVLGVMEGESHGRAARQEAAEDVPVTTSGSAWSATPASGTTSTSTPGNKY